MVVRSGLVAEASAEWKKALASAGFKKRSGEVYTRQVTGDVLGWLGLNKAVNRQDGLLEVNPVVGVRHQALERVVADLLCEKFHEYAPPTVSVHLGYVMPEHRYRPWLFGGDMSVQEVIGEMVGAILSYGVPFMERLSALTAVVASMSDSKVGIADQLAFRRPVGYLLLGDDKGAREALGSWLERIGDRQDLAAKRFRSFAEAFERRLGVS